MCNFFKCFKDDGRAMRSKIHRGRSRGIYIMAKRRFSAQEKTIKSQLRGTMNKIQATSLKISMDEFSGEVEVIFDRNGKRYTKKCSKWENSLDNMRAIGLSIEYLYRAVEIYGIESQEELSALIDSTFVGIEATPDNDVFLLGNDSEWWMVLGISSNATKEEIRNGYKAMARIHHPDMGGTEEQFKKVRAAYEEAIK